MRVQGIGHPSALLAFITDGCTPTPTTARIALAPFLTGTPLPTLDEVFITSVTSPDDWPELEMELNLIAPLILVPLGPLATRALLGDVDLHRIHSLPHVVGAYTIIPCFDPTAQALFTYDMHYLAEYLHG